MEVKTFLLMGLSNKVDFSHFSHSVWQMESVFYCQRANPVLSFLPYNVQLQREGARDGKVPKGMNRRGTGRARARRDQMQEKHCAEVHLQGLENLHGILEFSSEENGASSSPKGKGPVPSPARRASPT